MRVLPAIAAWSLCSLLAVPAAAAEPQTRRPPKPACKLLPLDAVRAAAPGAKVTLHKDVTRRAHVDEKLRQDKAVCAYLVTAEGRPALAKLMTKDSLDKRGPDDVIAAVTVALSWAGT
jgi:hypothetical protein